MTLQGRRLEDTEQGRFPLPYDQLKPGDYWKVLDDQIGGPLMVDIPTNLTGLVWTVIAPGPHGHKLLADLTAHTVREHEDGTISVRPGDGSSNSILVQRRPDESWHGYIEAGVWTEC